MLRHYDYERWLSTGNIV